MKVAAHPLVVAVAMGLLTPSALEGTGPGPAPSLKIEGVEPDLEPAPTEHDLELAGQPFAAPTEDEAKRAAELFFSVRDQLTTG